MNSLSLPQAFPAWSQIRQLCGLLSPLQEPGQSARSQPGPLEVGLPLASQPGIARDNTIKGSERLSPSRALQPPPPHQLCTQSPFLALVHLQQRLHASPQSPAYLVLLGTVHTSLSLSGLQLNVSEGDSLAEERLFLPLHPGGQAWGLRTVSQGKGCTHDHPAFLDPLRGVVKEGWETTIPVPSRCLPQRGLGHLPLPLGQKQGSGVVPIGTY